MEKFIIGVILLMCGEKHVTTALPQWVFNQTTAIQVSMVDNTACTTGIADISAASTTSQTISYTTDSAIFTVSMDMNTYTYKMYCDFSALQAQSSTVLSAVVTATDPGGDITRTFTLTLIDQYSPVFGSNSPSFTNCDVAGYSAGDILHTVAVTDADPNDIVTVSITSTGTPFSITQNTQITFTDAAALVQFFTDTTFPYTLDVRAQDTGSKHTTTGTITVSYTSGQDCNSGSGGSGGSGGSDNSGSDDDNGYNVLSYSVFTLGFLLVVTRLLRKL